MTIERWTDERLDRFASSVDSAISELSRTQLRMMQEFSESEVRGLQTENRRILDRMFGEQSN
jgi:hypothetical protein